MENSTIKIMALPTPEQTNWTLLGVVWPMIIAFITVVFKWIDSSFAARKLEREVFITAVVNKAMTGAMDDVNDKINTLFEYREKDRENLDRKFEKMMIELKTK